MQQHSGGLNNEFNCLKEKLEKLIKYKTDLTQSFDSLSYKIRYINEIYKNFLTKFKSNSSKSIIGFDAFYFQKTRFSHEYNYLIEHYSMLLNRIYYDIYNINNRLKNYYNKHIQDGLKKTLPEINYPIYNSLNIFQVYDFKYIVNLYEFNLSVLKDIEEYYKNQQSLIEKYTADNNRGLDISNFIFNYDNKNKLVLLTIEFYIKSINHSLDIHIKYFSKLMEIITLTHYYINKEINIQEFQDISNNNMCPFYNTLTHNNLQGPSFHMKYHDFILKKPSKSNQPNTIPSIINDTNLDINTQIINSSNVYECLYDNDEIEDNNDEYSFKLIEEP